MGHSSIQRIILLILDSLGIGELPDAKEYNDEGSNTLNNIIRDRGSIHLPNLEAMGIGLIQGVEGLERVKNPIASYGRLAEASTGKDTFIGHWEIAGLIINKPFSTYPDGFPKAIMESFEKEAGLGYLGDKGASGTEIIKERGGENKKKGKANIYKT